MPRNVESEIDDPPALSAAAWGLVDAAMQLRTPLFAVIDGARYRDLPGLLKTLEIDHQSLFLEHADKEVEAASGWLASIAGKTELIRLLEASDPACGSLVIWTCALGESALHRHLRTLNLVQIPAEEAVPGHEPPEEQESPGRESLMYESVLFRHCDPQVLASLLPLLDTPQLSRILGPCEHILFHASGRGGLRSVSRPADRNIVPRGQLRIAPEQIQELKENMADVQRVQIRSYLRQVAGDACAAMNDHQLGKFVLD